MKMFKNRLLTKLILIFTIIAMLFSFTACNTEDEISKTEQPTTDTEITSTFIDVSDIIFKANNKISKDIVTLIEILNKTNADVEAIPAYSGEPYYVINNNRPYFNYPNLVDTSFEYYNDLDELGRCGICIACIGKDLMPSEPRGNIEEIKPSGWDNNPYDFIDGGYLYNRCHLISYSLTGENANERNLITGTRYFNFEGMLPFENQVENYISSTENHVMYRVTPVFKGENLVCDGVLMEAYSVEDNGKGIQFNVFCYNVQPNVEIDYLTGANVLASDTSGIAPDTKEESASESTNDNPKPTSEPQEYVLNTNPERMRFHKSTCKSVVGNGKDSISEDNRKTVFLSREEVIAMGYTPCGNCKP